MTSDAVLRGNNLELKAPNQPARWSVATGWPTAWNVTLTEIVFLGVQTEYMYIMCLRLGAHSLDLLPVTVSV